MDWYAKIEFFRNDGILYHDLQQEITKKDESYEMTQEEDFYTLTIQNPTVELGGRYTLQVKLEKDSKVTSAYLAVQGMCK